MAKKSKKFLVDIDLGMNQMYNVTAPTQSGQVATYEWVTGLIQDEAASRQEEDQLLDVKIADIISNTDINAIDSFTEVVDKINGDISAESNRAQSAEVVLQANIDVEKGRIDTILSGSDVNLDQFREIVDFVQSIDMTNDDALLNAVLNIDNAIADEIANREAADSAIIDTVSVLDQTLTDQISTISDSLDQEVIDREAAIVLVEQTVQDLADSTETFMFGVNEQIAQTLTDLSAETAARIADVDAEEAARIADVDAEEARAIAAELSLQNQIDFITNNTDAAALDSLTEIVAAFQTADGDINNAITTLADAAAANLSAEVSRATSAELSLDNKLSSDISVELARATSAELSLDNKLSSDISVELARATSAELSLDSKLSSDISIEVAARIADVNFEEARARDAEGKLESELFAETARAMAAELVLTNNLSTEVSRATSAELSLESKFSSDIYIAELVLANNLSAEVSRATSAELSLDTRLSSESSAISTRFNQVPVVAAFTIGDGILTSFTLEHALGTTDVIVQIFEIATGSTVETESIRVDLQSITIQFSSAPSVDKYRVVAMGIKSFSMPA